MADALSVSPLIILSEGEMAAVGILKRYSSGLQETWNYAQLGISAIRTASGPLSSGDEKAVQSLRVALIYTAPLFFSFRDQLAYEWLALTPLFLALGLGEKIRQLPTLNQLLALVDSRRKDASFWEAIPALDRQQADALKALEESSLGVSGFRLFRERVVHHGLPGLDSTKSPFPLPEIPSNSQLAQEALAGCTAMLQWLVVHSGENGAAG